MAQVKHGNMINSHIGDEEEYQENNVYDGYLSSLSEEEEEDDSCNSIGENSSEDEDFIEDLNSSSCSLNSSLSSSDSSLYDMSSLISHLPLKRGLSKHYEGKSQSFTSLSSVKSLEDLIKTENPSNKKIKALKSNNWSMMNSSRIIKKKSSKGSVSSSLRNLKRNDSIFRSKPSFPTQRFSIRGLESVG